MNIASSQPGVTSSLMAARWLLPEIQVELHAIQVLLDQAATDSQSESEVADRLRQLGNLLTVAELTLPATLCHELRQALQTTRFSLPARELALEILLRLPDLIGELARDEPDALALTWILRAELQRLLGRPLPEPLSRSIGPPAAVALSAEQLAHYPAERFLPLAAKLHATYRDGLLQYRQTNMAAALQGMQRVVGKLLEIAPQSPSSPLLQALLRILAAMEQARLGPRAALLDLLSEFEPWLARLVTTGAALLNQPPTLLAALQPYAQLAGPMDGHDDTTSPLLPISGTGAAREVLLNELAIEIDHLKTRLEENLDLPALHQECERLRSTIRLLALPDLTRAMQRVIELLSATPERLDRLQLAEAVLELEAAVMNPDSQVAATTQRNSGLRQAQQQFMQQCAQELEELRQRLDDHLTLPGDNPLPPQVEQGLQQLQGGFNLMEWPELATAIGVARTQLLAPQRPAPADLAAIVDLLIGTEFYLQQWLAGERDAPSANLINLCNRLIRAPQEESQATPAPAPAEDASDSGFDAEIAAVFVEEAQEVLAALDEQWPAFAAGAQGALIEVRRGFHTLKGSGRMVAADTVAALAWAVEQRLNQLIDLGHGLSGELIELIDQTRNLLPELLDCFANGQAAAPGWQQLLQRIEASDNAEETKPEPQARPESATATATAAEESLDAVFSREAALHLQRIEQILAHPDSPQGDWRLLERTLHTLKGSANAAGRRPLAQLAGAMLDAVQRHLQEGEAAPTLACRAGAELLPMLVLHAGDDATLPPQFHAAVELLQQPLCEPEALSTRWLDAADTLVAALEQLGSAPQQAQARQQIEQAISAALGEQLPAAIRNWIDHLHLWMAQHFHADRIEARARLALCRQALIESIEAEVLNQPASDWSELWQPLPEPQRPPSTLERAFATPQAEEKRAATAPMSAAASEADEELLAIFMGEAEELLEEIQAIQRHWPDRPAATSEQVAALARALHTLKGGARLVGQRMLADICHEFETRLDSLRVAEVGPDELSGLVRQLQAVISAEQSTDVDIDSPSTRLETPEVALSVLPPETSTVQATGAEPAEITDPIRSPARGETLRLSASLLSHLLDLTNESTLLQERLERQSREFGQAVDEMELTIDRLRDQVRRLDIEAESELRLRHRQGSSERQDFDPLELDRYSQLQQLSRGLVESASDIKDLRDAMAGRLQQMRGQLLQQSHLHTELREGLARAQMVPFSRLVPRLGKMVRQLATELGKDVGLRVINPEVEIDRTVLERLITPLEHMLRNALDHGIESPAQRLALGKSARASITLQLQPQGSNLLLSVSDDGAGINVEQVLHKARSRGLIDPQRQLSPNEALQLIFLPGFSTASVVTQISGRGVGMDVVRNEVQALGGTIDASSRPGEGTCFELRLPYTLSANRALMVRVGGELYALPLETIEGVVRVSPYELEHHYQQPDSRYAYAGRDYRLRHLGTLLFGWNPPTLDGVTRPLPVILLRSQDDAVALQVDALEGSSEIVAKAFAPQFNQVPGIAGASLQGDEGAVIILDLPALLRAKPEGHATSSSLASTHGHDAQTCLVVDDSVTMRKVTSRLLERQGYRVLMARDGVEALAMLNESRPDVMLLDVEMPRMDGFELVSRIRHQSGLEDLPIIMITSRTGAKHRERARELGITHYLGKPYAEQALLLAIDTVTTTAAYPEQRCS